MKSVKISGVLLYLFAFALVLLLYFNYLFMPLSQQVAALNLEHNADTAQMQAYDEQISKITDLKQTIADTKTKLAKAALNTEVTGKTAAEDVALALKASGAAPQSVAVSDETVDKTKTSSDGKALCSVTIDLKVACTNAQLLKLLNYYEKQSKGIYYVNTVAYTQVAPTVASMKITLYYFSAVSVKP